MTNFHKLPQKMKIIHIETEKVLSEGVTVILQLLRNVQYVAVSVVIVLLYTSVQ